MIPPLLTLTKVARNRPEPTMEIDGLPAILDSGRVRLLGLAVAAADTGNHQYRFQTRFLGAVSQYRYDWSSFTIVRTQPQYGSSFWLTLSRIDSQVTKP